MSKGWFPYPMTTKRIVGGLRWIAMSLLETYVIVPLATIVLPPIAFWAFARDFVERSHAVPGWVFVVATALSGLLVVSVGLNIAGRRRLSGQNRQHLIVVSHGGPAGPTWQIGEGPHGKRGVFAIGTFDITNTTSVALRVPRTVLQVRHGRFGILPWRRTVEGSAMFHHLAPRTSIEQALTWHCDAFTEANSFRARVGLVDSFGQCN